MGRLHGKELTEQYQKAHIFALPSRNESFAMVILEAMACGLPVVATTVDGIPSLVENAITGFLVPPGDENSLSEKIIELINLPDCSARFGKTSQVKAAEGFSWQTRAESYNRLFEGITGLSDDARIFKKNNITVTHVIPHYPPYIGGMELRVKELAKRQAEQGLNVTVLTSNTRAPSGKYVENGVTTV